VTFYTHEKCGVRYPTAAIYTTPAAVWKLHHPFFFAFFGLSHIDGDFRLHNEFFCPWVFCDIVFELRDAFFVWPPTGTDHSSNAVLSNKVGRY